MRPSLLSRLRGGGLGISQAENQRVKSLEDYSVVTAPFNGVVTMRYADVGSLIKPAPLQILNPCQ